MKVKKKKINLAKVKKKKRCQLTLKTHQMRYEIGFKNKILKKEHKKMTKVKQKKLKKKYPR